MSFGVAFSGGGAKGAAHVGALLALYKENLIPSSVAGSSAGSVVAGFYASGMKPQTMKELVMKLARSNKQIRDVNFRGFMKAFLELTTFRPVTLSGILKGDKWENFLCSKTNGMMIKDSKMKIVIPAVDINSGRTIAFTNDLRCAKPVEGVVWNDEVSLCEAIRASSAVPVLFSPKKIGDMCLVDGGITDLLPTDLLIAAGEPKVLLIRITPDYERPNTNNLIEITSHCYGVMQERLQQISSAGETFEIHPELPEGIGIISFNHVEECLLAGYRATMNVMPQLKKLFG